MGTASDPAELIDGARIAARLDALWDVARSPGGGADRPAYSPAEAAAMRLVAGGGGGAGRARAGARGPGPPPPRPGTRGAPPAATGPLLSPGPPVDAVPDGGRHDGALGTV